MKFSKTLFRSVLEQLQKNTISVTQMSMNTGVSKKSIDGELFRLSQVSNFEFWMYWDKNDTAKIARPLRDMPIESLEWLVKWLYSKDQTEGRTFKAYEKEKLTLPDGILSI